MHDAATIASELVTNAVTAGSSAIELFLGLRESVRIEVADDAAGAVVPTRPAPTDEGARLGDRRGARARLGGRGRWHGKQVWAEVPLTDARPDNGQPDPQSHVA